ncbi:MAG: TetR/AcrR family transcriptional regulator [Pseudomonadota bacterium]
MSRMRRSDWLDLGLRMLTEGGVESLTVDALCRMAQRTRGSFYHHFQDHEGFLVALAETWRDRQTDAVIAEVDAGRQGARGDLLHRAAGAIDHRLDVAMRRAAGRDAVFAAMVAAVDARRIGYIAKTLQSERALDAAEAARLADLEYALFVGSQVLWPDRPPLSVLDGAD